MSSAPPHGPCHTSACACACARASCPLSVFVRVCNGAHMYACGHVCVRARVSVRVCLRRCEDLGSATAVTIFGIAAVVSVWLLMNFQTKYCPRRQDGYTHSARERTSLRTHKQMHARTHARTVMTCWHAMRCGFLLWVRLFVSTLLQHTATCDNKCHISDYSATRLFVCLFVCLFQVRLP